MKEFYLVRHAESQPSRTLPEPEWPLSPRGVNQAQMLVPILQQLDIQELYSSPFPRAVGTFEPFAAEAKMKISKVDDFREMKLTDGFVEDFMGVLSRTWQDFDYKLENCESSRECQTRFVSAIRQIAGQSNCERIAISSHGNAIGLFLNSMDSNFSMSDWMKIKNPDIFRISFESRQFHWDKHFSWSFDSGVEIS